ncbi:MAG: cysteine--tRNA ligase [Actinomycetota bacterium]|nr:cysteine--tRNA ligase [Actinomycetota bacterium]
MLRLHDTPSGRALPFEPRDEGEVSMYVCGPTVYDLPHVGHGRAVLVYDVLRRYLEWLGYRVRHVSNITDIDDKIIQRAQEEGRPPEEVAREYEAAWYDAVDRLGVARPTVDPHATDYVEGMVDLVGRLLDAGRAYVTSDGVYLATDTVPGYGLLALQPLQTLRAGARVDVSNDKRSPLDFALWKLAKPGEPSWPSPWGAGRPGWHTECVVMSLDLLGDGFDLHAGGMDLMFPHHENERAQAVALGHVFARHWMHHAFVEVGGEKMSKSLGNFTTLTELIDSADPRAFRLLVLMSHYRKPMEVTRPTVEAASRAVETLDEFSRRAAGLGAVAPDPAAMEAFRRHMDDDFDTPAVVAQLADLRRRANTAIDAGDGEAAAPLAAAVAEIAGALGLELAGPETDVPAEVLDAVDDRQRARAARDYAAADSIRARLDGDGWVIEDTPQGPRVHRRA